MRPILEICHLSHAYKIGDETLPILSDLNFSLMAGEMVAVQGPSGSGKSSLLYLVGCLQQVQKGKIFLDGEDVSSLNEDSLAFFRNRRLGFIFQQFHLLPKATVLENILLPAHYPSEIATVGSAEKQKARELAKLVGLSDRLDHRPNQLSGGQQQRVAIARSLMNDPALILADEPTGNLDSKSSAQIMELLRTLNGQGHTILLITHDREVALKCDRIHHIRDGKFTEVEEGEKRDKQRVVPLPKQSLPQKVKLSLPQTLRLARAQLPVAWENLNRNKIRSSLTMLGITIGIAAVLSMVTLGQFTKWKILDSYAELGVNTLNFYGYRNWEMKATDAVPNMFQDFNWEQDILPLREIFPEIDKMSPTHFAWSVKARLGGKSVESDVRAMGINHHALTIMNRKLQFGNNISSYHVENGSGVCLLGSEVAERLMPGPRILGQTMLVQVNNNSFSCRVIGVLKSVSSNKEWNKPNLQVLMPSSYFVQANTERWYKRLQNVLIQLKNGSDVEKVGKGIRAFFEQKYGASGRFIVDSDSVLISQMQKFLTLFTILLTFIALVSLAVGGIGITNMMLVSVSERFREIGLRKALGATPTSIRLQFLMESILICGIGGLLGIVIGLGGYHGILFGVSKLMPKLGFTWLIDWSALIFSVVAILIVGVVSGLFPALKAERLQVIEALRSE